MDFNNPSSRLILGYQSNKFFAKLISGFLTFGSFSVNGKYLIVLLLFPNLSMIFINSIRVNSEVSMLTGFE